MRLGSYEIHAIETGRFALDGGAMFGVVPKNLWNRTNPADEQNRITLAARCLLLLHDDGRKVLIDNGLGHKFDEKLVSIYQIDHTEYTLERSLAHHGLTPNDITDMILTHLHFDHAGGSTVKTAEGRIVPTFPQATYYVQKNHLVHARNPTEKDRASFFKSDFEPVIEAGRLHELDGESCPLPNIRFFVAHGHSPYQQLPILSDSVHTLFFCGDLVPTATHVQVPYVMAYDNQPLVTIREKKDILGRAFDEQWTLVFEHDPQISAARIRRDEKGYRIDEVVEL